MTAPSIVVRLIMVFLATLCAGVASGQPTSTEVLALTGEVLARKDWLALSNRCPASVMPRQQSLGYLSRKDCRPGQMRACMSRCVSEDAAACYWLAEALQEQHAATQASEALYQRACRLGIVSGCTNRMAGMTQERRNDPDVLACAAQTYTRACEADDPWGCTMQAVHLSRGIGAAQNRTQALRALEKSCKYGTDDPACTYGQALKKELQSAGSSATERK